MAQAISLERLTRRFGELVAVDGISFEVGPGEVLGFLGPNGAGKSTTMKMLSGFLAPSDGTARIMGKEIQADPQGVQAAIGYLPEGAPLYGDMTPKGFLSFVASMRGFAGRRLAVRIGAVLERLELGPVAHRPIETLSKGYKRRVGLAAAILHDPPVLILDEPTDGLDPNQKHEVRALIADMAPEKAIMISTHLLEEVTAVCTRAIIIAEGRIVADGTPFSLQARSPWHDAVALSLEAADRERAELLLGECPGVRDVRPLFRAVDGADLLVVPLPGARIGAEVARLLEEAGIHPQDFRIEIGRLDDVFRALTLGGKS